MCGIIGYAGDNQAAPILLEGLSKLEYRGYDSAGIAVFSGDRISVKKSKGRLSHLSNITQNGKTVNGVVGIGHTRWATHGEPSDLNSHPHISKSGRFAVVHNGIIENYISLKDKLTKHGTEFLSETDTEIIAHLFEYCYSGDTVETLIKVMEKLEGSYALGIMCLDRPDEFVAVRKSSPLIVGLGKSENFIASDLTAVLNYTKKIYYLEDNEIVVVKKDSVKVYNLNKEIVNKEEFVVNWDVSAAEKGGYEHFMMKEIEQQPGVLAETIKPHLKNGEIVFESLRFTDDYIKNIGKIHIIGCGTAYHVGVAGKYIIEKLCRIPVEASVASEFRYGDCVTAQNDLAIVISQSGETADTIAAIKKLKEKGTKTIGIVNVLGSTAANMCDYVLYTRAGPEISVASTKAYSTQLCLIYLLSVYMSHKLGTITESRYKSYIDEIRTIPCHVAKVLKNKDTIRHLASKIYNCSSMFFIGRNLDYAVSLEGSLKLKEISYIHSEAYPAGELKHGAISLIENGTFVVALATCSRLRDKTVSNIKEVKARGASVLVIANKEDLTITDVGDYIIDLPELSDIFMPSVSVIPLQLFAYYVAYYKGCDIDKPRNLAKSVTVE